MQISRKSEEMSVCKNRLKTFKNWQFGENTNCSALKMAQAGFYLISSPDVVACYYCNKELDGWEIDDKPYEEHWKHAAYCPLLKIFPQPVKQITVRQYVMLEEARLLFYLDKELEGQLLAYNKRKQKSKIILTSLYNKLYDVSIK